MKKIILFLLMSGSAAACLAQVTPDNVSSPADWVDLCRQERQAAVKAAKSRNQGVPEDRHLQVVREVMAENGSGPKAIHVMLTITKGAYVHSDLDPLEYSKLVMKACQDQAEAAFPTTTASTASESGRPATTGGASSSAASSSASSASSSSSSSRQAASSVGASSSSSVGAPSTSDSSRPSANKAAEAIDRQRQADAEKREAVRVAAQASLDKARAEREENARKDRYLKATAGAMKLRARFCPDGKGEHYIVGNRPAIKPQEVECIDVHYTEVCPGNLNGPSGVIKNFLGASTDCFMGDTALVSPRPVCAPEAAHVVVDKVTACQ